MKRTWRDNEALAKDLVAEYPGVDPLTLDLQEVRGRVVGLSMFGDDPDAATEEDLEAIQQAWYEALEV